MQNQKFFENYSETRRLSKKYYLKLFKIYKNQNKNWAKVLIRAGLNFQKTHVL